MNEEYNAGFWYDAETNRHGLRINLYNQDGESTEIAAATRIGGPTAESRTQMAREVAQSAYILGAGGSIHDVDGNEHFFPYTPEATT